MANDKQSVVEPKIYFSEFFEIDPAVLAEYGALDVSLINDLPLFIDPFLLFDSENPEYTALHEQVIRYVKFLRDVSLEASMDSALLDEWFRFPEVKQNWLGFSRSGNRGTGLGKDFATALQRNLSTAFRNFGAEKISRGSHLEKLCLLGDGVGRDHLSDFTTNLVKGYLLRYTETFATQHLQPTRLKSFSLRKVTFDYESRRWKGGCFKLPAHEGDFVLLTPRDILTKDEAWINRSDLINDFQEIFSSIPDQQLRAQVNEHFRRRLSEKPTEQERRAAAESAIRAYPLILDHYIRGKEENGADAHQQSDEKVRAAESQFIAAIKSLVRDFLAGTSFYEGDDSYAASLARVRFLKDVVENKGGHRIFYVKGKPIKREADLHIMYRLTWNATTYDVSREANDGRGPADFKISKGARDKTIVEFKLASNSKLEQNLRKQAEIYKAASDARKAIKAILYFSEADFNRAEAILKRLDLLGREDVVLIDARADNKASGSKA